MTTEEKVLKENETLVKKFEENNAEIICVDLENDTDKRDIFEDDGTLHIVIGKLRGCFINDDTISKSEWNSKAKPLIKTFGFKWSDLK